MNVVYQDPECVAGGTPQPPSNTKLCFPVRWAMPPAPEPSDDWFHKYVVAKTVEHDKVTDAKPIVTRYEYVGGGAWAFDDNPLVAPKEQTWSQWRGFEKVVVRKGDPTLDEHKPQSQTSTQYFRGMHGDKAASGTKTVMINDSTGKALPDSEPLAGFVREQITYNGVGGAEVSGEINDPWIRQTGTQLNLVSNQVETIRTIERTPLSGGSIRTTQLDTTYDQYGNATQINDLGDVKIARDDRCTTTTYVANTEKMLVSLPSRETVVGVACGTTPNYPADAVSDSRISYDGEPFGTAPKRGLATQTEVAKSYQGSDPTYLTTNRSTHDAYGRVLESKDALGRTTTTGYSETNGLATTVKTTNPLGHTTIKTLDPGWGLPIKETDPNNRTTTLVYDGLGRLAKVWKPGRPLTQSAHLLFAYGVRNTGGPSWVRTQTLKANGNQVATYALLDGFLRPRQTQAPSPRGGRILTDTLYDTRGLAVVSRAPYYDESASPGTTLVVPDAGAVPAATVTTHDGAERKINEIYLEKNVEKWRTTTSYGGDQVTVVPPAGGTVTTTFTDARDQQIALQQWHGRQPQGESDETRYSYTKRGDLASIKDAAGNVWRYEYDVLGRRVKADDPDRGVSTMTYDDAGQQRTATDARGKTIAARYDELGRPIETRLGSDDGTLLTRSVYDTLSKGHPTSSTRFVDDHEYVTAVTGYDAAGRPEAETVTIPAAEGKLAGTYRTSHTYAADDSPRTTTLPTLGDLPAETLTFGYDDLGLSDTLAGTSAYVTDTEHTALGEVAQLELGTGDQRLWRSSYYEDGTRRLSETLTTKLSPNGAFLHDLTYGYDPVGNVTRIGDRAAGSAVDTQCFTQDYLRRTTEAWTAKESCDKGPSESTVGGPASYWQQFAFDPTGNRTRLVDKSVSGASDVVHEYTYPDSGDGAERPHAVTSVTSGTDERSYDYDAAGNTVRRPSPGGAEQELVWTEEGLLASVGSTSYVYGPDGKQLLRRDPGKVTLFLGSGEVMLDTKSQLIKGTRYYDGIGTRTAAGLVWTVADHHGTSQAAIDAKTLAVTARRFNLFGAPREAEEWSAGDRGFVGGTANSETGLTRLGAREYDPAMGRFLSVDPQVDPMDPQTLNAYAYSNNNPTTMSDPDGLAYIVDADGHVRAPSAKAMSNPVIKKNVRKRINKWSRIYQKRADRAKQKAKAWKKPPTKKSPTAIKDADANPNTDQVWKLPREEWNGPGEASFLDDAAGWLVDNAGTINAAAGTCALVTGKGTAVRAGCAAVEWVTWYPAMYKSAQDCQSDKVEGCIDVGLSFATLGFSNAAKSMTKQAIENPKKFAEGFAAGWGLASGGAFRAVRANNSADRAMGIVGIFSPFANFLPGPEVIAGTPRPAPR
ncbi:RHS repeat domain-containing protein [Microlunatus sp. GCM10028923]